MYDVLCITLELTAQVKGYTILFRQAQYRSTIVLKQKLMVEVQAVGAFVSLKLLLVRNVQGSKCETICGTSSNTVATQLPYYQL